MAKRRVEGTSLRIAFLNWRDLGHPEAGGAEMFLARVSEGLAAAGHAVTVHVAGYPGGPSREQVGDVTYLRKGGRFSVYPRTFAHLVRRRRSYDVIVDVQNGLPFWSPLLRRPVVNVTHHVHREQWPEVFGPVRARVGWWLESRLAPRIYRRSHYLVVSKATRDDLVELGVSPARISIAYSGLDAAVLPFDMMTRRNVRPSLLVLGRLVPHKRVELAIDAVSALRDRFPGLNLTVVGGGYWRAPLEAHAALRGVSDAVRFTGVVDDATKHDLLARTWLNLLPSLKEGWGLVVVEAGSHSTPTVAFRSAGGTTESVIDGRTGVLVDDPDEFIDTIGALLADEATVRTMGAAARAHAAGFIWSDTTSAVERVLQRAVGARPPLDNELNAVDGSVEQLLLGRVDTMDERASGSS